VIAVPGFPLLVMTDRRQCERPIADVVRAAVEGGARAVVLREKDLPRGERARLAETLRSVLATVGGVLVVASDPTLPSDGVHLAVGEPFVARPIVGRSCHDAAELADAAREGCTYATLSPIFASASKPGYGPTLGVRALAGAPLPTYALGGVAADNAVACVEGGAVGVAVMGAVMRAADPTRVVRALLGELGAVPA
jgi:thiamine-phosphate diphosphorylase